jgi:phospholipase C
MITKYLRILASSVMAATLAAGAPGSLWAQPDRFDVPTKTPIKHVVVLFQENISFDHYFGTYPYAANPESEPQFRPDPATPRANNLLSGGLLTNNPNTTQPFRLDRSCPLTSDQSHSYTPEQKSFDHGLMDAFQQNTGTAGTACLNPAATPAVVTTAGVVMGYYDGNTVTAMWNWAQHYALSDNFYGTMFGPSTVGVLNLVGGSTTSMTITGESSAVGTLAPDGGTANSTKTATSGTLIGDVDAGFDDCSTKSTHGTTTDPNIGILLSGQNIPWGWFQGGFAPTTPYNAMTGTAAACALESSDSATGLSDITDYVSHHNGFAYNAKTANPHHLPPTGPVGFTDQANHGYDLSLFLSAISDGTLPSVSFVKAKAFQNGHPGNSTPLDEQTWLVTAVNAIENSKYWDDTAIFITYDDSDGWYDHQMDTVVNQSSSPNDDDLSAPGACGTTPTTGSAANEPGRCGYGPRLPLLVISKYARSNYIDHRMTDQSSIIRFIEDNWSLGRLGGDSTDVKAGSVLGMFDFDHSADKLTLDPSTGEPEDRGFGGFGSDGGFGGFDDFGFGR